MSGLSAAPVDVVKKVTAMPLGSVGTTIFAQTSLNNPVTISFGEVYAGSALRVAGIIDINIILNHGQSLAGSWQAMGVITDNTNYSFRAMMWRRIS